MSKEDDNTIDFSSVDEFTHQLDITKTFDKSDIEVSIDEKHIPTDEWKKFYSDEENIAKTVANNFSKMIENDEVRKAISPESNSYTKKLIKEGYSKEEAMMFSLCSIMFLMVTMCTLNK